MISMITLVREMSEKSAEDKARTVQVKTRQRTEYRANQPRVKDVDSVP